MRGAADAWESVSTTASAIAALRSDPTLSVAEAAPLPIAGRPTICVDIETTLPRDSDPPIFSPVVRVAAGPISLATARRLRVIWLDLPDGPIAILIGGSIDGWPRALAMAQPVIESVTFDGAGPLRLRPVEPPDLDVLFEQGRDPEANAMAAFGPVDPDDRAAFDAHWRRILDDPSVVIRVVEVDGAVAGSVLRWRDPDLDAPEVSYWIGREFWGRGVATAALRAFLEVTHDRPLYGRTAATNIGSIRVLEKGGFRPERVDREVPSTSGALVDEVTLRLDA